jgi:putative membrane protein
MGFWGWAMMLAFWLLVVVLIVWTVRSTAAPRQSGEGQALRILDERLARGEIDPGEYEERRQLLASRR